MQLVFWLFNRRVSRRLRSATWFSVSDIWLYWIWTVIHHCLVQKNTSWLDACDSNKSITASFTLSTQICVVLCYFSCMFEFVSHAARWTVLMTSFLSRQRIFFSYFNNLSHRMSTKGSFSSVFCNSFNVKMPSSSDFLSSILANLFLGSRCSKLVVASCFWSSMFSFFFF